MLSEGGKGEGAREMKTMSGIGSYGRMVQLDIQHRCIDPVVLAW